MSNDDIWKKMTTPKEIEVGVGQSFGKVKQLFDYYLNNGHCVRCPLSGTIHNMPYRRTISKGMARSIKVLYRIQISGINDGTAPNQFADFTKLRYWGLIKNISETNHWVITTKGREFVEGSLRVAKNAIVVNNVCTQFMGETVSIDDILSK